MSLHHPETTVTIFDGTVKKFKELKIGEKLFGPNGQSRIITKITYLKPNYCLTTFSKQNIYLNSESKIHTITTREFPNQVPKIENIKIDDWLNFSKWKKSIIKLTNHKMNYSHNEILNIDPYFLGVLLGDGCLRTGIKVTSMDHEIVEELDKQAAIWGLKLKSYKIQGKADDYSLSKITKKNMLIEEIKNLNLYKTKSENKFIPNKYFFFFLENRLQLLAGLIDTDGSKADNNCYDYLTKSHELHKNILYLSRSLGFKVSESIKNVKYKEEIKSYYRSCICGENIPCKISRKQSSKRQQKKSLSNFGFNIQNFISDQNYIDLTVDSDHLYLDDNFIVLTDNLS